MDRKEYALVAVVILAALILFFWGINPLKERFFTNRQQIRNAA
jgi:hypothetical protein